MTKSHFAPKFKCILQMYDKAYHKYNYTGKNLFQSANAPNMKLHLETNYTH